MGNIISGEQLRESLDLDTSDTKQRKAAQCLVDALNDWPILNLSEPQDLLAALYHEVGPNLTYERLKAYSETLRPDRDAWKMEATNSLLQIFAFDYSKTLDRIVSEISEFYERM